MLNRQATAPTQDNNVLTHFHPLVAQWFTQQYGKPSEVQKQAWPAILQGQSTLIAAPTGSGKTLAAFYALLDQLVLQCLQQKLPDTTLVLYVSPLKALSNDIHKNLEEPLDGLGRVFLEAGIPDVVIRAQTRTGDTSSTERAAMKRNPPHILVTTPESLYLLLTSASGREMLENVSTVIVDEIHALAGNKRGAHLMLSLARLDHLTKQKPRRIGLSATQKPIQHIADMLMGTGHAACSIIDTGHVRQRDLQLELTGSPLQALMSNEVWSEIYDRLEMLINQHRTTLIFVNTRRLAERAAAALAERLDETSVTAHHGSLAKEHRLLAEQRLKQGKLKALVATASLELGIDIGDVDLVCQLGSPGSIATFLQRVGRSGHQLKAIPKGRLFPLSRDDLLECTALLAAIKQDQLDQIHLPDFPLDVLAQQIVAEVAYQEWDEHALYQLCLQAWPYRKLTREKFTQVVKMLADGFHTQRGRSGAYLHRDIVQGKLRPAKSARLTALLNGGVIPDQFDYDVIMQPEGLFVGTLNEDFSIESIPGDIFQLGNNSYRMLKIEQGKVYVEDAHGQPPNIPFWFGEAPGRTDELSQAVSDLSSKLDEQLQHGIDATSRYLQQQLAIPASAATQLSDYLATAKAALTTLPTLQHIIFERFFDETGDMHLVIHSPYGSRINRAWGLALRKRFCRRFNFELQAAAGENNIVLSLGPTHSFPLLEPVSYLTSTTVEDVLTQALLNASMFPTRWRWVTNTALAVPRMRGGKKVPAIFQRNNAEDLIALIFPDQLACNENITGNREVPEHPLVDQTLWDCMHELMDSDGLKQLLKNIENGTVQVIARDLSSASPMALEILNARPYAFLDDAPAEERRTLAIQQRRFLTPADAEALGQFNPDAIERVKHEAWPQANSEDELYDALVLLGYLTADDLNQPNCRHWTVLLKQLQRQQRVTYVTLDLGINLWVAVERLNEILALFPACQLTPKIEETGKAHEDPDTALLELLRSRLECLGPITEAHLAQSLAIPETRVSQSMLALQQQGFAVQGKYSSNNIPHWCERGLLARMHRYTLKQLRSEIEPVSAAVFMQFLFTWQGLHDSGEGEAALLKVIKQLQGCSLAAAAWEKQILSKRLKPYLASELDQLCSSGQLSWLKLIPVAKKPASGKSGINKSSAITLMPRENLKHWQAYAKVIDTASLALSATATAIYAEIQNSGASFFQDLLDETGLLKSVLQEGLSELITFGLITADSFQGLRQMILPQSVQHRRSKRYPFHDAYAASGRWSAIRQRKIDPHASNALELTARCLLHRYGVVFRKVLDKEEFIPSWRELLNVYRRLEARGEIRGGRFVQGFAGEQFALPEAVSKLRQIRKQQDAGQLLSIGACDPLNLTGIITPGEKVPAKLSTHILYRDGIPLAWGNSKDIHYRIAVPVEEEWRYRHALLH